MDQIWFDPNLSKTLKEDPTYNDYKDESFIIKKNKNIDIKIIKEGNSIFKMSSEDITIKEYQLKYDPEKISLNIKNKKVHSLFLIEGELELNNQKLEKGTFFKVSNSDKLEMILLSDVILFEIISPINPSYKTYVDSMV